MDSSEGSADSHPAHGLLVESVDGLTPDSLQLGVRSMRRTRYKAVRILTPVAAGILPASLACLLKRLTTFLLGVLLGVACLSLLTSMSPESKFPSDSKLVLPGEGFLMCLRTPPATAIAQISPPYRSLLWAHINRFVARMMMPHLVWRCTQCCGDAPWICWASPKCVTSGHPRLQVWGSPHYMVLDISR